MRFAPRVWLLLFALPLSLSLYAQQDATAAAGRIQTDARPDPSNDAVHRTEDHHLTLDVVVTNRAGKPVPSLEQSGFIVTNNKKPQAIASFHANNPAASADPLKVIILVDEVNTGFSSVAFERDALKKYLQSNGGKLAHPVSMIFFSDTSTEMLNGTSRDGNALSAALDQHETKVRTLRRSAGFYGAEDRFQLSLQNLRAIAAREEADPGRKLLLWISPGWPLLSGPRVSLTAREEQSLFDSIVSITTSLRRAHITLYSIDPLGTQDSVTYRTTLWQEYTKGVAAPNDAQAGDLALQVFAFQSGGRVLNSNNDVAALIATAAAEADAYYEVTIDLPPGEHPDEYHTLQVKMEQPGLTARTLTGYYAQP